MGSIGIAAWIAHLAFWGLLGYGSASGELRLRGIVVFLLLWLAGLYGLPYIPPYGAMLFSSFVAALDVALVFLIFRSDVAITCQPVQARSVILDCNEARPV